MDSLLPHESELTLAVDRELAARHNVDPDAVAQIRGDLDRQWCSALIQVMAPRGHLGLELQDHLLRALLAARGIGAAAG